MSKILDTVVVETGADPDSAVIWLHGLGADGHDFEPIVPELGLSDDLSVRFVFPHSPVRSVTVNNGMAMRAWYDIKSLDADGRADEQGIRESQGLIEALIRRELERGVRAERLVLAGFSQGAAMALHTGLRYTDKLAGIMGLSGYLPLHQSIAAELSLANRETPVFLAHGSMDPVVSVQSGKDSHKRLLDLGVPVQWHEYPMAHQVCMEELQDIGSWLNSVLAG